MKAREKRESKSKRQICDSKSLWNRTRSPGWTDTEITLLKYGIKVYGVGNWEEIKK